ncbi:MAG: glycosyltransferase family 4 protein [Pseudomonadota bacterium]
MIKNVAYLAPVYEPAIGGGVVYLRLLSKGLIDRSFCERFTIVTEAYPDCDADESRLDGRLRIIRKYPFRAGRSERNNFRFVVYLIQNLQFFLLPLFARSNAVDVLFVHGSLLNNPTTLWIVERLIRLISPRTRLIADLRDPKMPISKIAKLRRFDMIISCSRNITNLFDIDAEASKLVREIPIIVEVEKIPAEQIDAAMERYGLARRDYVFNGSGLVVGKGVERLLEVVHAARKTHPELKLVVAGKKRQWTPEMEAAQAEGWFIYLGQMPQADVHALSAGAYIDANLSSVDSMPRHSLEALAAGARVLLPAGVPEFDTLCPGWVSSDASEEAEASKLLELGGEDAPVCSYPIEAHNLELVVEQYMEEMLVMFNEPPTR